MKKLMKRKEIEVYLEENIDNVIKTLKDVKEELKDKGELTLNLLDHYGSCYAEISYKEEETDEDFAKRKASIQKQLEILSKEKERLEKILKG